MEMSLLKTKSHIPSARPGLIPRQRLVEQLQNNSHSRLILISAPAGSGKTLLIAEWLRHQKQSTAWLSLDEDDSNVIQFWTYVLASLQVVQPQLGQLMLSSLSGPGVTLADDNANIRPLLSSLINEISTLSDPLYLVLDDYHLITATEVHRSLNFLIDNMPPQLHVVLITREDPPVSIPRMRVRGEIVEIRAADLHFSEVEAGQFFAETMRVTLTEDQTSTLVKRTEGWVAGLQMAALSLQGRADSADFIETFAGDDRYVVDFLLSEVLARQPVHIQAFLVRTSILNRFTAALCDAVTDQEDGRTTLATLEETNLFLVALDNQREWYRYHHLFADLLRYRLKSALDGVEIRALHGRAAAWYAQNDLADEAIQHGLLAEDTEFVADYLESKVTYYMRQGYIVRLMRWFDALPEHVIVARPFLCVYHGWIFMVTGQSAAVERRLQDAEQAIAALVQPSASLIKEIRAHINAMQAYLARRDYRMDEAIQLLRQALADLPPEDHLIAGVINYNLGFTYLLKGQVSTAIPALEAAKNQARISDNPYTAMAAATDMAQAYAIQGHLRQAQQLCAEVIADALTQNKGQPHPLAGFAYANLGALCYEFDDLDRAEENLKQAIELGTLRAEASMLFDGVTLLARLRQLQGDHGRVESLWQQAFSLAQGMGDATRLSYAEALRVRAWMTMSESAHMPRIDQWKETIKARQVDLGNYQEIYPQLVLAHIEFIQGQPDDALVILAGLEDAASAGGWGDALIKVRALRAVIYASLGETETAEVTLNAALSAAAAEGYVRTFIELGQPMLDLLALAVARQRSPTYAQNLLDAFGDSNTSGRSSAQALISGLSSSAAQTLIEPLNERELAILRLIAAGLSNREIGQELHLSLNTIKWYASGLYGKLGVGKRAEAIDRAHELGIL